MSSKGGGFFSSLFGSSKSKSKDDTVSESVENTRSKEDPVVEIKSGENTEEYVTEESKIKIEAGKKTEISRRPESVISKEERGGYGRRNV